VTAEAPEHSPLRLAGRIVAALMGAAFVLLLVYGLLTKSTDRTVDDGLRKSGSVAAPALNQPVLERGDLGQPLRARLGNVFAGRTVALAQLRGTPIVLNFWASCATRVGPRPRCSGARGRGNVPAASCSSASTCRTSPTTLTHSPAPRP
jgi:hypothetical protein